MNMKKRALSRLLAWVLSLCLVSGLLPISVLAAELGNVYTLSNENLQVLVDKRSGGFSIRTLEGDAIRKDDNNKNLLFPLGDDDTSFASLRVTRNGETKDYVFGGKYAGSSDVAVTATSEEIQAVWSVDGITVTQTLRLANPGATQHGMAYLSYTTENSGEAADIRLRLLMDTALGTQDYGVYEVAQSGGGYLTVESERSISGYQNSFFAYDDPQNPSVFAYFLNGSVGDAASTPEQVTFARWNNLAATVFDYTPDESLYFTTPYNRDYLTADSAFALYYDLGSVGQGGSAAAAGYYGVFSNAAAAEGDRLTLNFTDLPQALEMNADRTGYTGNGDFTVTASMTNISGQTLDNVRVVVYPGENITPYDKNGVLQKTASYLDPYYIDLTNVQADGSQNLEFQFRAVPGEDAAYRKLTFQAYEMGSDGALQAQNLLCAQTVWLLCPGTGGDVPQVGFTSSSPDLIYITGTRHLYLTGRNFSMLSNQSAYSLRLSRTDGGKINGQDSLTIPANQFILNTDDNTADVVITDALAIGEYQLTIDYTDTSTADITAPALRFQVTDDPEYRNDGYGVVTVENDGANNYSIHTYATEKSYEAEGKELGNGAVLLEFRGSFTKEEKNGTTVLTGVSLGKEDNVMTLNNCLDIREGQVTITDANDEITVDFDASLTVSGVGTSVWKGRCCLTAIVDGESCSLTTYDDDGNRQDDGSITLLWPSVGQAAQSLLGLLFEFKYGELGYMDGVGGVIGFGGGLDLSFLIPAAKQADDTPSALDQAKEDLIRSGEDTPENLRALEEQHPHNADTVNTNAPPFETSTDMGDGAEAGDGDSRSATIQVDDILFGGGKYQGVNFSVALGLPSYFEGMPGIEGVLTVRTVGDWAVDVSGAASFATFAMEAELAVQSKDGIPYPDTLHFFVGGFVPGINLDGFGVIWLQGAGGGINNLYDTIFLTESVPPLQLILEAQFSILQIISARATLALSLQGISAELSNGVLANSVAVLDSASLEFDWYPEFFFLSSVDMNIAGVLQGGGYLVLDESGIFEFFIRASLSLPGTLPLIGGLTLANVGMGVNAEKIWGAAEALGIQVGITYYWGSGEVSWSGDAATPNHPDLLGLATVPVYTAPDTGRTLYAVVGTNATLAAQSQLGLVASTIPTTRADGDSLKSNVEGTRHELVLASGHTSPAALTLTWDSASLEQARKEAEAIIIDKYTLTFVQDVTNASATENANAKVTYDSTAHQANMTVTFQPDRAGTYSITTGKPASLALYRVAPLPGIDSVSVTDGSATVTGTGLEQFSQITLLAVDKENPDNSRMVGHVTSENGAFGSTSVAIPMDTAALPSGDYTLQAIAADSKQAMVSTKDVSFSYTNPNQPAPPQVSAVKSAGDYKVSFTVSDADVDGYRINFYDAEGNLVSGVSGLMLEKSSTGNTYTAGGQATVPEYQTDEDGQLVLDSEGNLISTGNTVTVGLEVGKTYTMGVSAYRTVNGVTLYSEEATASVQVSAPNPPAFSWNADVEGTTVSTKAGEETFSTLTYRTNALTVTLTETKRQAVSGVWSLDGGAERKVESQSTIQMELTELTEGSHTIRFQGTNSQGDAFLYTKSFSVDTTPPALLVSSPISGSFFGSDGSVTLTGWTDGTLSLLVDGRAESITVTDGSFSQSLTLDDSAASHTLTLTATDAAGNTTTRTIQVVNPALGQMTRLAIYSGSREVSETEALTVGNGGSTLSVKAVLSNGSTLDLSGSDLVEWSVIPAIGTCEVDDFGHVSLSSGGSAVVKARMAITDDGGYTAFAALGAGEITPVVTITPCTNGTITVTGTVNGVANTAIQSGGAVDYGSSVTIQVTPAEGYYLNKLVVNGSIVSVSSDGTYVIDSLKENLSVTASFSTQTNAEVPAINTQPTGASYTQGDTAAALTVEATVTKGTLSYQWYSSTTESTQGGTPIDGATEASYIPSTADVGTTYYYCVVTNTDNEATGSKTASTTSDAAAVTVAEKTHAQAPVINTQPTGASYTQGDSAAALTVAATVTKGTLSYQWYSSTTESTQGGTPIDGATEASYIPSTATVGTTYYYCVVTNTDDTATGTKTATSTSDVVAVTISAPVPKEYTITFHAGGGSVEPTFATTVNGKLPSLPTPTRSGYSFAGWYTAADGGTAVTTDTQFTQDAVIYARWSTISGGGSSKPLYTVTVPSTVNGSVSISPRNAAQGTIVTITVNPADGYIMNKLTVTDSTGKLVPVDQKNDAQYTFSMPSGNVSIAASFIEDYTSVVLSFTDVKEGDWFYEAVQFAVQYDMMNGTGSNRFQPDNLLSRSMIVTILWRLEGSPTGSSAHFTDVSGSMWYAEAVNWAAANGLVNGYGNSTFGPEDSITREQMAAILYRYAQFKGYDDTVQGNLSDFTDGGQTSDWAEDAVVWAVNNGLLTGKGGSLLDAKGSATRAEAAAILMRFSLIFPLSE